MNRRVRALAVAKVQHAAISNDVLDALMSEDMPLAQSKTDQMIALEKWIEADEQQAGAACEN